MADRNKASLERGGRSVIDEKTKEKLKRILVSIAVADASEAIEIARGGASGTGEIKMSKDLSRAISSMRDRKSTRLNSSH